MSSKATAEPLPGDSSPSLSLRAVQDVYVQDLSDQAVKQSVQAPHSQNTDQNSRSALDDTKKNDEERVNRNNPEVESESSGLSSDDEVPAIPRDTLRRRNIKLSMGPRGSISVRTKQKLVAAARARRNEARKKRRTEQKGPVTLHTGRQPPSPEKKGNILAQQSNDSPQLSAAKVGRGHTKAMEHVRSIARRRSQLRAEIPWPGRTKSFDTDEEEEELSALAESRASQDSQMPPLSLDDAAKPTFVQLHGPQQEEELMSPRPMESPVHLKEHRQEPIHVREMDEHLHFKSSANLMAKRQSESGAGKLRSLLSDILSGIVCGTLMFVFASVFSFIIFSGDTYSESTELGVEIHLFSAAVSTFITARYSGCNVAIAGPDINPTVFLAAAAVVIDTGDTKQSVATLLFTIMFGTLLVGVALLGLGHYRLTRVVQFVPAPVLSGFLASVGFKVMVEAISVATGIHVDTNHLGTIFGTWDSWKLLLPALPVGLSLYFLKRYHVGSPVLTLPLLLFLPLIAFYIVLAILGMSPSDARASGWLFPESKITRFFDQWETLWAHLNLVDLDLFIKALPDVVAMVVIVVLDFLLKLAGTEKALQVDLDLDQEFILAGKINLFNMMHVGVPSYGQMKFSVLNYNIIGTVESKRAAYIVSVFLGVLFLTGMPIINFLPRFFASALLVYAAMGFLVTNLWDTARLFTISEALTVWVIVIVNVFLGLIFAVVIGVFLAAGIFAIQYSKRSVLAGSQSGSHVRSTVLHPLSHELKLQQLGKIVLLIELEGFLFFGIATTLLSTVSTRLAEQASKPEFKRLRYIVLDFQDVCGLDMVAAGLLAKVKRQCNKEGVKVIFCGMTSDVMKSVQRERIVGVNAKCREDVAPALWSKHVKAEAPITGFQIVSADNIEDSVSTTAVDSDQEEPGDSSRRRDKAGNTPPPLPPMSNPNITPMGSLRSLSTSHSKSPNNTQLSLPNKLHGDRRSSGILVLHGTQAGDKPAGDAGTTHSVHFDVASVSKGPSRASITSKVVRMDSLHDLPGVGMATLNSSLRAAGDFGQVSMAVQTLNQSHPRRLSLSDNSSELDVADNADRQLDGDTGVRGVSSTYATVDLALEAIEDRLLHYANLVRSKWLIFPAMKRLNAMAAFKALHGPFHEILEEYRDVVWQYMKYEVLTPSTVLFRIGDIVDKLYLLQFGRVSSYLEHKDGSYKRVSVLTHGSFADAILGTACSQSVVVDSDSVFITLTRRNMARLEHDHPAVALAVHKAVLQDVASRRSRAVRLLDDRHEFDGYERLMELREVDLYRRSRLLSRFARAATTIMRFGLEDARVKASDSPRGPPDSTTLFTAMYPNTQEYRGSPVTLPAHQKQAMAQQEQMVATATRIHQTKSAPDAQQMVLQLKVIPPQENFALRQTTSVPFVSLNGKRRISSPYRKNLDVVITPNELLSEQKHVYTGYVLSNTQQAEYREYFHLHSVIYAGHDEPMIAAHNLRHAAMDLGYYESREDMKKLLDDHQLRRHHALTLPQFLAFMKRVSLQRLPPEQVVGLKKIFKFFDSDNLGRINARQMLTMFRFGLRDHHEVINEDDVLFLMRDWSSQLAPDKCKMPQSPDYSPPVEDDDDDFLSFDGWAARGDPCPSPGVQDDELTVTVDEFLSMLAFAHKHQDVEVELDKEWAQFARPDKSQPNGEEVIKAEDVQRVVANVTGVKISPAEAAEMLWVADTTGSGSLTFREFVEMLSIVFEPGWIVQWSWRQRQHHRFAYNVFLDGEFDGVEDEPEPPSPKVTLKSPARLPLSPSASPSNWTSIAMKASNTTQSGDDETTTTRDTPNHLSPPVSLHNVAPVSVKDPDASEFSHPLPQPSPRHMASDALDPLPRYLAEKPRWQ